jgi:hypothetical protein
MDNEERLETILAILIAIVAVIAGLVAWRASVADDGSGDAEYAGLRANVNAEETRTLNAVNAYQNYGAYVSYWRNWRLAGLLQGQIAEAETDEEAEALAFQLADANNLANAARPLVETRFLNRDGSYNVSREMGERWADAAKEKDMEYEGQFKEADTLAGKSLSLLFALTILSIAPIFYSLIESVSGKIKMVMLGVGSLFLIAGLVMAIIAEFSKV